MSGKQWIFRSFLKSDSRTILGSAIQFENLLPANLCQSVDPFGTESIFNIFHRGNNFLTNFDIS